MPNLLRNALAVLAGAVIGGGVNTALITLGPSLIPPPAGVDVGSAGALSKALRLSEPRHLITPFLAHDLLAPCLPAAGPGIQIGTRITQGNEGARKREPS